MKIAVTSQHCKTITGHAGKCRKFRVYEVDDKEIVSKTLLERALQRSFDESHGAGPQPPDGMHVLISGGTGQKVLQVLGKSYG